MFFLFFVLIQSSMSNFFSVLFCLLIPFVAFNQAALLPAQATSGPGGAAYLHEEVIFQDFADKPDGYWLFEPASPRPDSANVILFVHGYGGYNPMIYGSWVKHLVRKGNIVIYPRYQRNMVLPRPNRFSKHVARAILDAKAELENGTHIIPKWEHLAMVGHSYGGVIITDLAVNYEEFNIPKPEAAMICSSGTGWLRGGQLKDYSGIPEDLKLVIFISDNDLVTGDEFSWRIFNEAVNTPNRLVLRQSADYYSSPGLNDGHNQTYALDQAFDSGVRNYTAKKALRISTIDPVDYNGYWKVFDALLRCTRSGKFCEEALCGCPTQTDLGNWSDGQPLNGLEATLPSEPLAKRLD